MQVQPCIIGQAREPSVLRSPTRTGSDSLLRVARSSPNCRALVIARAPPKFTRKLRRGEMRTVGASSLVVFTYLTTTLQLSRLSQQAFVCPTEPFLALESANLSINISTATPATI